MNLVQSCRNAWLHLNLPACQVLHGLPSSSSLPNVFQFPLLFSLLSFNQIIHITFSAHVTLHMQIQDTLPHHLHF